VDALLRVECADGTGSTAPTKSRKTSHFRGGTAYSAPFANRLAIAAVASDRTPAVADLIDEVPVGAVSSAPSLAEPSRSGADRGVPDADAVDDGLPP
jgi:hypothetical protein